MSTAQEIYNRNKPSQKDIRSEAAAFCDRFDVDSERGMITYFFQDGSCLSVSQYTSYVLIEGPRSKK